MYISAEKKSAIRSILDRGLSLSQPDRTKLKGAATYAQRRLCDRFIPMGLQRHLQSVIQLWEDANA
tara:strand:+ start:118 stop:315 length:198 start_codon:yes stop_codon:yes gene_type:complete